MSTPVIESPEPTTVPASPTVQPTQKAAGPARGADKRAEALRAKKKKKRDAHRVTLRRSHTGG